MARLVAGVDSSTQSCKVVIHDVESGALIREGRASHPDGTEVDPEHWWTALNEALSAAGGLDDVDAIAIGGQQHGMVLLDDDGNVVRDALLWNDTRSAADAAALVDQFGAEDIANRTGSVPVASFTISKLRWVAHNDPAAANKASAVCLPHDWLSWRLRGTSLTDITTDRGDASGTGYFSPTSNSYDDQLLQAAFGRSLLLPRVLNPSESAGVVSGNNTLVAPGTGDNMGAALGVNASLGDVIVSIGTSGTVFAVSSVPTHDTTGTIAGFADATGNFLPLVCTLNAARILTSVAQMLNISLSEVDSLALSAPAGAEGVTLIPYFEGERTPNRPDDSARFHGLRLTNSTPANIARAAVEGLLAALADGLDALTAAGVPINRVVLVGGGAQSQAVRELAPAIFGHPVVVPPTAEYVARGAARQAAWALTGNLPEWELPGSLTLTAEATPAVRDQYLNWRDRV